MTTISQPQPATTSTSTSPPRSLWGLTPSQLHDRFWAARGVQIVRQGSNEPVVENAELYMLCDDHSLVMFRLHQLVETLNWLKPRALLIRLRNTAEHGYREKIVTDENDRFVRFERVYGGADSLVTRLAMTPDIKVAKRWNENRQSPVHAWRELRHQVSRNQRTTASVDGKVYNSRHDREVMHFVRELVQIWRRPAATIARAVQGCSYADGVWTDRDTTVSNHTRFIGPVWIGAGRQLDQIESIVGPTVLWDDPAALPKPDAINWHDIEPAATHEQHEQTRGLDRRIRPRRLTLIQSALKRTFDIAFALIALAMTLPIYPFIMLAIFIEDGTPFFFLHRRETRGGREFPCLKFRTMRKDAEKLKEELVKQNQADGPQFFIDNDPRHTRIGRIMRRYNIDELPQFFNVLLGQMSIVGPRPSPHSENQFCPPWREARLSVRPGVTGLWQVLRSRREGLDFQEWIRYDIEYVENYNWQMDMWILWRTIRQLLHL